MIKVPKKKGGGGRNHYKNLLVGSRGEGGIAPGRAGYKELAMFNFLT